MSKTNTARLVDAIGAWIKKIDSYPGWKEWQRKKIAAVMSLAEGLPIQADDLPTQFEFNEDIEHEHEAIMAYLSLNVCLHSLQQCEFYFRRYPFNGLPVSRDDHIRNICEMYFNRFYEFKSRLKRCLNAINSTLKETLNVGAVLKQFAKEFDQELRARNSIHHFDRFDDLAIQGIGMASLMGRDEKVGAGWQIVAQEHYRRSSREWAERVKRRSKHVEAYLEAVAGIMLQSCSYLRPAESEVGPLDKQQE